MHLKKITRLEIHRNLLFRKVVFEDFLEYGKKSLRNHEEIRGVETYALTGTNRQDHWGQSTCLAIAEEFYGFIATKSCFGLRTLCPVCPKYFILTKAVSGWGHCVLSVRNILFRAKRVGFSNFTLWQDMGTSCRSTCRCDQLLNVTDLLRRC